MSLLFFCLFGVGFVLGFPAQGQSAGDDSGEPQAHGESGPDQVSEADAGLMLVPDPAEPVEPTPQARWEKRLAFIERSVGIVTQGEDPEASTALLLEQLTERDDPELYLALLWTLARTDQPLPGYGMPDAVVAMMDSLPADSEAVWAEALGRYELERIATQLADLAGDEQAPLEHRRLAVRALGEHRQLFAVEALIGLTGVNELEQVRGWAFDALANLTHRPGLGRDRAAWAEWYQHARRLSASQWRQMLHDNLLRLTRERGLIDRQVRDRLIQTQRALHRATAADQRPALLIQMLQDPLDPVRSLAMELLRQRAEDNGEFGPALRAQLRARLDDDLARIREESATLLGQLLDAEAADEMARRLGKAIEPIDAVQRAYLVALTQMPRVEALEPAYALLESPVLRPQAAGMLAAALDEGLGDAPLRERIGTRVRGELIDNDTPLPQMVTLLGLVIAERDGEAWSRIGGWLDAEDDRVRAAAARVWAESSRSLVVLAERSEDPVIRPFAFKTIAERGSRAVTLTAVAERRPAEPEDLRLWEAALVGLAGRVPPGALLETIDTLTEANGETRQVREHMLTAAIDRPDRADPPTRDGLRLLIARAEARVLSDAPALVVLDYEAAIEHADRLTPDQVERARRGLTRAYLADQRIDAAIKEADLVLRPEGKLIQAASADPLITTLIDAAQRAAEQGRSEDAGKVIAGLRQLLGESLSSERDEQLKQVQAEIDRGSSVDPES